MKEFSPHYVLPWAERTPWARPNPPAMEASLVAYGKSTEITRPIGRRPIKKIMPKGDSIRGQ